MLLTKLLSVIAAMLLFAVFFAGLTAGAALAQTDALQFSSNAAHTGAYSRCLLPQVRLGMI